MRTLVGVCSCSNNCVSSGFQYYYSIKDISVGGMCICYGHAQSCPWDPVTKVTDNKLHPLEEEAVNQMIV